MQECMALFEIFWKIYIYEPYTIYYITPKS